VLVDPSGLTPLVANPGSTNWAYEIANVFADLDSADPVRRTTAYVTLAAGGVAIAALAVAGAAVAIEAAPGVLVKSGLVEGVAIAGAGTGQRLRDAPRLVATYGGELTDWAKMVSRGVVRVPFGGPVIQIHWYENPVRNLAVEAKWKLY
jgi:filamentous hemagglutinin